MKKTYLKGVIYLTLSIMTFAACKKDSMKPVTKNPDTAENAIIDRFSATAGHLQVRTNDNGLPQPNAAVNFDQEPFITKGLGPAGQKVQYYNFDVQPVTPAPIYVLFKGGQPVSGQLNIVDVIPGNQGYNDFWQMYKVTVPDNYVANSITSYQELVSAGYPLEKTDTIINCPIVPKGSTATRRLNGGDAGLARGWYKDKVVFYFNFFEHNLTADESGKVPVIPIFVTFNINPNETNGGAASGFKAESQAGGQTHNVVSLLPSDAGYSPLWLVKVYDNKSFDNVSNLATALNVSLLDPAAGNVNCPVVSVQ